MITALMQALTLELTEAGYTATCGPDNIILVESHHTCIFIQDNLLVLRDGNYEQPHELAQVSPTDIYDFLAIARERDLYNGIMKLPHRDGIETKLIPALRDWANYIANTMNGDIELVYGGRRGSRDSSFTRIYLEWVGTNTHNPNHKAFQRGVIDYAEYLTYDHNHTRELSLATILGIMAWIREACDKTMFHSNPNLQEQ